MVLCDGLTFGGKVWEAGDICVDVDHVQGFPKEVRGVSTLDPDFRDKNGRRWFRVLPDPEPDTEQPEEPEAGADGSEDDGAEGSEDSQEDEAEQLDCQYCGKPYKSEQWLKNHEEQCTQNPGE